MLLLTGHSDPLGLKTFMRSVENNPSEAKIPASSNSIVKPNAINIAIFRFMPIHLHAIKFNLTLYFNTRI